MKDVSACLKRCCSPSPWQPWLLLAGTPTIAIWFDIFQMKCARPNIGRTNTEERRRRRLGGEEVTGEDHEQRRTKEFRKESEKC